MSISERHLFRERAIALQFIAAYISEPTIRKCRGALVANTFELLLSHSRSLEQSGDSKRAIRQLESSLGELSNASEKVRAHILLATLHLSVGNVREARIAINIPSGIPLAKLEGETGWVSAAIDVTSARIAREERDDDSADRLLKKATTELRRECMATSDGRALNALATALHVQSSYAYDRGRFTDGIADVEEGLAVLQRCPIADPIVQLDHQIYGGLLRAAVSGSDEPYGAALFECYNRAVSQHLTREAFGIRVRIGSYYRRTGQFDQAFDWLNSTTLAARHHAASDILACALLERAIVEHHRRNPEAALATLAEAASEIGGRLSLEYFSKLVEAMVLIGASAYNRATLVSQEAERYYAAVGQERLLAEALSLKSSALIGLRKESLARDAADSAGCIFDRLGLVKRADSVRRILRRSHLAFKDSPRE